MNRLELAAQAPLMPDWYYEQYKKVNMLEFEAFVSMMTGITKNKELETYLDNSPINWDKEYNNYWNGFYYGNHPHKHRAEIEWRFYWADEMIKRNEQK